MENDVVSDFVQGQLSTNYGDCSDAFSDIFTWFVVLYGDWYGNKSGNTIGYYFWNLIVNKIPAWAVMCSGINKY